MLSRPQLLPIYHITDIDNLPGILAEGGLHSDANVTAQKPTVIGYSHIKTRRLTEIRVNCCGNRFVGEFVPFYYCPRSPMLYTINRGNAGRPAGCQRTIVHLVSTIGIAVGLEREWAISDGNAGASHTWFYDDLSDLRMLDWNAIRATNWQGKTHEKHAEFLVADFFPWNGFTKIGCYNRDAAGSVSNAIAKETHKPVVTVETDWYY